jgi:tagatose-6-phosphate ketose/aldose isomerase
MNAFGLSAAQLDSAGAHWTAREILQQPQIWAAIEQQIAAQAAGLKAFLDPLLRTPELRIVLTGAGTSAHIGECLAPALTRILARRIDALSTTDLVASPTSYLTAQTPTLMVSFGRSGNSPESMAAIGIADQHLEHCHHLIFTCDAAGALYQHATHAPRSYVVRLPEASNDRSFAMTSSFTGMLLAAALALRGTAAGAARMAALAQLCQRILPGSETLLHSLVSQKFERVVYLGAREFHGLAREASLKMLELTDGKVVSIADSPLGFRHGPKTILNTDTLVVVFVSSDPYTRQYDVDLIEELRRDGVAGRVITLSPRCEAPLQADDVVLTDTAVVGDVSDLELCLPYAMFAQALALLRSLSLGVRPDSPNAAGTVSRVVKGVSIHPWRGGA